MQIYAAFLREDLDNAQRFRLRKRTVQGNDVFIRYLYLYEKAHREGIYVGLKTDMRKTANVL